MLNKEEIVRYSRHLLLPEIGITGQEMLKNAKVLVIGAGGLGCPVLLYLTASGVGEIGVVDFDRVDASNLQRQVLYTNGDIGKKKVAAAVDKLTMQNPHVEFISYDFQLTPKNALETIANFDIVIDGTDNFSTRYMVNDACVLLGKPLIYGAIYRFEGQVSVFNSRDKSGILGPTYRCLFPKPPDPSSSLNCSATGVLGVLPGIIGTIQANEAIKIITGVGEILSGRLLIVNMLTMNFNTIEVSRSSGFAKSMPESQADFKAVNYDFLCEMHSSSNIKNISPRELLQLLDERDKLQILDVREAGELPVAEGLVDLQISLSEIPDEVDKISKEKRVVVFCKGGQRSKRAIEFLQKEHQFSNLYNLEGGIIGLLNENQ